MKEIGKKFYILNGINKKISKIKYDKAKKEDIFDEVILSFNLLIPIPEKKDGTFFDINIEYMFNFYKDEKGAIEVCFNDENKPTIEIDVNYFQEINNNNILLAMEISQIKLKDFLQNSIPIIISELKILEPKHFFDFELTEKVKMNKKYKKELTSEFKKSVFSVISYIFNSPYESEYIKIENNDFIENKNIVIKKLDSISEFNDLRNELKDKKEIRKIKI